MHHKKPRAYSEIPPFWGQNSLSIADVMQVPWDMSEDVKL